VRLQRAGGWRRELLLLFVSMAVARIGFGVMIILFPSYLARSSNISLAVVLALYPLMEAATAVPAGVLCDRHGRRRVFLGGLGLMGCLIASISLTQNVLIVAALHALMGLAAAAITVSSLTMITDLTNPGNRGKGMGTFDFSNIGGYAGGLLVGGWLSEAFKSNLADAFVLTGAVMILALSASFFLLREPLHVSAESKVTMSFNPFAGLDQKAKAILPIWLSLTSLIGIVFFLPRALRQVGVHETLTGELLFAGIMIIGIGSVGFGALSDRLGRETTMAIGAAGLFGLLIGLALLFQSIGTGLNFIRFLPIIGPAGIATSALVPSVLAAVGDRAKEGRRGATMGLYSLMLSLGIALGELLAGFASLLGGLSTILYSGSVIFLGASLLTFALLWRVKRSESTRPLERA
jgi:MFS family permease